MTAMMNAHISASERKMAALKSMIAAMEDLRDDERAWCVEQLGRMLDTGAASIAQPSVENRIALPASERPDLDVLKELE